MADQSSYDAAIAKYLADNQDVANSGVDGWQHFIDTGQSENRTFGEVAPDNFSAENYLANYPDVADDPFWSKNPGLHYSL